MLSCFLGWHSGLSSAPDAVGVSYLRLCDSVGLKPGGEVQTSSRCELITLELVLFSAVRRKGAKARVLD